MMWLVLFLGAILTMSYSGISEGVVLGLSAGTILYLFKRDAHVRKVQRLLAQYAATYGAHTGLDDHARVYGGIVGALVGGGLPSGLVGTVLGAGVDFWRDLRRKEGMSEEQIALYDEIKHTVALPPGLVFFVFVTWVLLMAGVVYFLQLMFR